MSNSHSTHSRALRRKTANAANAAKLAGRIGKCWCGARGYNCHFRLPENQNQS